MQTNKKNIVSLDKFIQNALYRENSGYYMKKNPIGEKGDFITSPNISILFSEMLSVWILSFWENLKKPKKMNLIELGAGNGEMMHQILKTTKNFKEFFRSCNFYIYEKSPYLKKIQKEKVKNYNVKWIKNIKEVDKNFSLFIANEFFDAFPIKQFVKKNKAWFEKYINLSSKKFEFKKINIKNYEKKFNLLLSKNQNFIEFSPLTHKTLNNISKLINKSNGGILIIDYAYSGKKMIDSLQSVKNHKKNKITDDMGNADITYMLNLNQITNMAYKLNLKTVGITTQGEFLKKLGILERAEIISKNLPFTKKADIYFRLKRLIDKKYMGKLFKVVFLSNKKISFELGF